MGELTQQERDMLTFAGQWWLHDDINAQVTAHFSMTTTNFYRQLFTTIDKDEAAQEFPLVVRRLRRWRDGETGKKERQP